MMIQSKVYGKIEIDETKQVYYFEEGIPAFEELKRWVIFESQRVPFFILQSLENEDVSFFLMNPWLCRKDYEVKLEHGDLVLLDIKEDGAQELLIFAILSIPVGEPQNMSINLQAPLVFNTVNHHGAQIVLSDGRWQVRHLVSKELERDGKGKIVC